MPSSNQKILRKKVAAKVEAEITTVNVDIEEFYQKFKEVDFKTLHSLSYDRLKSIREDIQWLLPRMNKLRINLENIGKDYGHIVDLREEGLPQTIISDRTCRVMEDKIKKENPEFTGSIIEIVERDNSIKGLTTNLLDSGE